ncbi:hypothetical protein E2C01_073447 [Portunus trituberculatus]|uniref:Uncharacterized protein n=1 Tax=Portunus trituberculatus TaxID=210409 RepID=A0A5B7IAK2_PORTR|nr:hypothetical protein [Portunus trituberculatus]
MPPDCFVPQQVLQPAGGQQPQASLQLAPRPPLPRPRPGSINFSGVSSEGAALSEKGLVVALMKQWLLTDPEQEGQVGSSIMERAEARCTPGFTRPDPRLPQRLGEIDEGRTVAELLVPRRDILTSNIANTILIISAHHYPTITIMQQQTPVKARAASDRPSLPPHHLSLLHHHLTPKHTPISC